VVVVVVAVGLLVVAVTVVVVVVDEKILASQKVYTTWSYLELVVMVVAVAVLSLLPVLFQMLLTYLLTPWSRVLLEKLTSKLCS